MEIKYFDNKPRILSREFIEWFRGFSDGEGSFTISNPSGNSFTFTYSITLHLDDKSTLDFICSTLGLGVVSISKNTVIWRVRIREELEIILAIFSKYNLNSTKHHNFLAFTQAFILYHESNKHDIRAKLKPILLEIKDSMNNENIADIVLDTSHYKITPNWLLGFVEGDGSFSCLAAKTFLRFSITQKGNKGLMIAINDYLNNFLKENIELGINYKEENTNYVYPHSKDGVWCISIVNLYFIENVIIPFFSSLTFHTKKYLDYCDWVAIFNIRRKGLHYLPEGKELIKIISNQMNSYRLTTNSNTKVDRAFILSEIANLLSKPANYEIAKDGRIWIISEQKYLIEVKPKKVVLLTDDGTVIKSFESLTEAAKSLGYPKSTITYKFNKSQPILFDDKLCRLVKNE